MSFYKFLLCCLLSFSVASCHGYPETVTPVTHFDVQKYMGKWYEVARLDHSFERGLSEVSAQYRLEGDTVIITNKGYSKNEKKWEQATGKAVFANKSDNGHLHVSFFGPFSSTYLIFELGKDYEYAFVSGPNTEYLWLLSRTSVGNETLIKKFIETASRKGFATEELIIVEHGENNNKI